MRRLRYILISLIIPTVLFFFYYEWWLLMPAFLALLIQAYGSSRIRGYQKVRRMLYRVVMKPNLENILRKETHAYLLLMKLEFDDYIEHKYTITTGKEFLEWLPNYLLDIETEEDTRIKEELVKERLAAMTEDERLLIEARKLEAEDEGDDFFIIGSVLHRTPDNDETAEQLIRDAVNEGIPEELRAASERAKMKPEN